MVSLLTMLLISGAAVLALWSIAATIAPKFDLIVTLLRHGPQPIGYAPDPTPVPTAVRVTRRSAGSRLRLQPAVQGLREAA